MQPQNLTIAVLLTLLLLSLLSCADKPIEPELTEEEINALIDARIAEELAKMEAAKEGSLSPQSLNYQTPHQVYFQ